MNLKLGIEVNDIYLLQLLAETLNRTGSYFRLCSPPSNDRSICKSYEAQKTAYLKYEGRFESIPFIESSEEVLKIISTAIRHNFKDKEKQKINDEISKIIEILNNLGFTKNKKELMFTKTF